MSNDKEQWLASMTAAIKRLEKARLYLNKWQDELEDAEREIAALAAQTQQASYPETVPAYVVPAVPTFDYQTQTQE